MNYILYGKQVEVRFSRCVTYHDRSMYVAAVANLLQGNNVFCVHTSAHTPICAYTHPPPPTEHISQSPLELRSGDTIKAYQESKCTNVFFILLPNLQNLLITNKSSYHLNKESLQMKICKCYHSTLYRFPLYHFPIYS